MNQGNERNKHQTGFNEFKHEFAVKDPEKLYFRFCKYGKALKNEEYIYALLEYCTVYMYNSNC